MDHFEKEYNLEIQMLSQGVSILYSFFANKKKVEERKKMPMSKIIESITKKEFPPNQLFIIFELIANDFGREGGDSTCQVSISINRIHSVSFCRSLASN